MKKRIFAFVFILVTCIFMGFSSGCGSTDEPIEPEELEFGKVTLTYVSNSVVEKTEEYSASTKQYIPVYDGFDFVCWTINGQDIDWDSFETTLKLFYQKSLKTEITLTARWERHVYKISLDVDGGEELEPLGVEYKQSVTKLPTPVKDGYTFLGWYSDKEYTTKFDVTTSVESDFTIYAKWIESNFNIKFDTNGGTEVPDKVVEYNTKVGELPEVTKEGHIFKGWFTDKELTKAFDSDTLVDSHFTLYAKWEIMHFTVKYMQSTLDDVTVDYGSGIAELPQLTKEEHTFKGWYKDQALENEYVAGTPIKENLTLYPKFVKNSFVVKFETNGGSAVPDADIICNTKLGNIVSTKLGYRFTGWFSDSELKTPFGFEDIVTKDMTLYAGWEALTYTVVLNYHAPEREDENHELKPIDIVNEVGGNITIGYGEKLSIKTPSAAGYKFMGWYTSYNENNKTYSGEWDMDDGVIKNMTLHAKWEIQTFTITFYSTGGTNVADIKNIAYGTLASKPANPTRIGYAFRGWYTSRNYTQEDAFDWQKPITSDVDLYALWQEKPSS